MSAWEPVFAKVAALRTHLRPKTYRRTLWRQRPTSNSLRGWWLSVLPCWPNGELLFLTTYCEQSLDGGECSFPTMTIAPAVGEWTIRSVSWFWTWFYCWGTGSRDGLSFLAQTFLQRTAGAASWKTDSWPPVEGHTGGNSHKQAQSTPWAGIRGRVCFLFTGGIFRTTFCWM